MRGRTGAWCWSAPRPDTARRSCWPTGPGAASAGGLAVAGRWRQRPGPVLAPCGGRAGPGVPGHRRAGRPAARPACPAVVRAAGDGADQRTGRRAQRGRGAAGAGRLPPDRLPAGARLAGVPAGAPAAGPAPGAGQPSRPAAGAGRGCGPDGQLAELRAAELRFTADEAAALLAGGGRPLALPDAVWRRWRRAQRGGRPGCSWPRCRCAGRRMSPDSWPRSPAATVTCWISWPRRCSSARASRCALSCWRPRCWSGCQRWAVRRGHRPHRQPGAAGAGGAGGTVPGAAG